MSNPQCPQDRWSLREGGSGQPPAAGPAQPVEEAPPRDAIRRDVPLYAMCSASRVLAAAGVIGGRRMVGSPRFAAEYEAAGARYEGNPLNDNPPISSMK